MARTRSARAHREVLKATFDLIAEKGIDGMSVDAIALASGVSKATIYKHWPNKDALCIEALGQIMERPRIFDSGDPKSDLISLLQSIASRKKSEKAQMVFPRIVGYAAGNPEFGQALRQYFEKPQLVQIKKLLQSAIESGTLRQDMDFDFAADVLIGPIMRRRFLNRRPIPDDFAEKIVQLFWDANVASGKRKRGSL